MFLSAVNFTEPIRSFHLNELEQLDTYHDAEDE
jgi:hypothetical protein